MTLADYFGKLLRMGYRHRITLTIPAQVSCVLCIESQQLVVGSDDGSVRLYDLGTCKVLKAIRGLGPISSVALHFKSPAISLWVACGQQAFRFSLKTDKLILTPSDVLQTLEVGVDNNDTLGDLSISAKGTKMAFCTDSGSVGIVDLKTGQIKRMNQGHDNVGGTIRFIPGHPNELVSGGYDCALLHFDLMQGSMLSRDDLSAVPPSSGVSFSPPFIISLSISPTGILAAGTADGRLYINASGEKSSENLILGKRRRRKWNGLDTDGRIVSDVAGGPIVALDFTKPRELLTCTLLGKIIQFQICGSAAGGTLKLEPQWKGDSQSIYKVNSIASSAEAIVIGGFQRDGTGAIEIWSTY